MTLKCIVDMKARHFYIPEDPPFDMKHQLMSADPFPVVKLTLSKRVGFQHFSNHFGLQIQLFDYLNKKT